MGRVLEPIRSTTKPEWIHAHGLYVAEKKQIDWSTIFPFSILAAIGRFFANNVSINMHPGNEKKSSDHSSFRE